MPLSEQKIQLAATLKSALAHADALSLGLVAISIATAIDHLGQALRQQVHFPTQDGPEQT